MRRNDSPVVRWRFRILIEALLMARAQPVATGITLLVALAATVTFLLTVGQTIAVEQEVLKEIDAMATRTIEIRLQAEAGVTASAIRHIGRLSSVEWVAAFGRVEDVRAPFPGSSAVPGRGWIDPLPPVLELIPEAKTALEGGTWLGSGAQMALGMASSAGTVLRGDEPIGVAGTLNAAEPLAGLNEYLLWRAGSETPPALVVVLSRQPADVERLLGPILSILGPRDLGDVAITTSTTLEEVRRAIAGQLGKYGRELTAVVLGGSLAFMLLTSLGGVQSRRKDFGRRRALGASRGLIVGLVTAQQAIISAIGTVVGALLGVSVSVTRLGLQPDIPFSLAACTLVVASSSLAALPPALLAALRDPVRALRVP